jgi:hypothetical protein
MTRPPLTLVGKDGLPDTTAETAEMIARAAGRMAEAVQTDGSYWLVTAIGEDVAVMFYGGKLESSVLAETMAGEMKREAVGL